MSGRGKSCGGRGKYQGKPSFINQPRKEGQKKEKKKPISEWLYYIRSAKQASDYKALTEYLINQIKQEFDLSIDIANAMIEQEPVDTSVWIPTLRMTTETDPTLRENLLEQYKIMFQSDYDQFNRREAVYEMNIPKAYELFRGKCSKEMQNKIEARPEFKSSIENNPFNLLKAIKEHSTSY
jgi:acyl-CoA thioesterase